MLRMPWNSQPDSFLASAASALEYQTRPGRAAKATRLLAYAPFAKGNMFQSLLYNEAWSFGFAPVALADPFDLDNLPWFGEAICHFHWLGSISDRPPKGLTPKENVERFERLLETLKQQGRKIVWTVHNILPHDAKNIDLAIRVRRIIAEQADAIHIMTASTEELTRGIFEIDKDKTFFSMHPSYEGAYPDYLTRDFARFQLGISPADVVFLSFGAIKGYKGLEELADAFCSLAAPNARLLLAGSPGDPELLRRLRKMSALNENIQVWAAKIPTEDVQLLFRAADYAVCPYTKALNSGAAMLALTFGVPVIAPAFGCFEEIVGSQRGILYDPNVESALEAALKAACARHSQTFQEECLQFSSETRSELASRQFFTSMMKILK